MIGQNEIGPLVCQSKPPKQLRVRSCSSVPGGNYCSLWPLSVEEAREIEHHDRVVEEESRLEAEGDEEQWKTCPKGVFATDLAIMAFLRVEKGSSKKSLS